MAIVDPADLIVGPVFDNCGILDTLLSQSGFDCNSVGSNNVLVTLVDNNGNFSTQSINVTVYDTAKPIVVTQNLTIPIDTSSGTAQISVWDLVTSASDNCAIDSAGSFVVPSTFGCAEIGLNQATVYVMDVHSNIRQINATVDVTGATIPENTIEGPMTVCGNAYNVKYAIQNYRANSSYSWNIVGGSAVSTSFKGHEVYVHWYGNTLGVLQVTEINNKNCGSVVSDTSIAISGTSPDTATIVYWSSTNKNTLVSTDQVSNYYQWGFDEIILGQNNSVYLAGETTNSYYNPDIESNINDLGYRYWCETSFDGTCWTRSYFEGKYPVGIGEYKVLHTEIWPNPFAEQIRIRSHGEMNRIVIYDMLGKQVYRQKCKDKQEVELSNLKLPAANYMLEITYKNGAVSNHKIVGTK